MCFVLRKNEGPIKSLIFLCRLFSTTMFLHPVVLQKDEGHIQSLKFLFPEFTTIHFSLLVCLHECFGFPFGSACLALPSLGLPCLALLGLPP